MTKVSLHPDLGVIPKVPLANDVRRHLRWLAAPVENLNLGLQSNFGFARED
jgi:hypothetical protein